LNPDTNYTDKVQPIILFDNESLVKKLKYDTFFLKNADLLDGDILTVRVTYSGGCKNHDFILATLSPSITTEFGHEVHLALSHENNGDVCKKMVTESLYFDLLPLKETHQRVYRTKEGLIVLHIMNRSIKYEF
jgi:hypothetical protein